MDPKDIFERRSRRGIGPMEPAAPRPSGLFESVEEALLKRSPVRVTDGLPRALEFRRKTRSWFSFPYHCLMNLEYHPNDRLTLTFATHKVTLEGRNLASVYEGIRAQDCARVEEMDRATRLATADDEPEIHAIEVVELGSRSRVPTDGPDPKPRGG